MAAGSTYAEYTKGNSKADGNKKAVQPPPAEADFLLAAKEAAAGAGITQTPSEIVIAFNSWKMSLGRSYSSAEEEASDLRSFATNADMITQHLTATRDTVATSVPAAEEVSVEFEGVDWRGVYNAASMARNAAEAEKAKAAAGRTSANDKLRQAQATASQEEQKAYSMAQETYVKEVSAAADDATRERSRLASALTQVAETENDARVAAQKRLQETMVTAKNAAAGIMASAQAERKGQLFTWEQTEEAAEAALKAAEADMAYALAQAKEQEAAAKASAETRAGAALAAQSEAKALLEMLKQTQEKALTDAESAAQQRRDMESQVEAANKRAQKAKLAAQAALEEL